MRLGRAQSERIVVEMIAAYADQSEPLTGGDTGPGSAPG